MDVFALRQRLVEDYAEYVGSFLEIADPRIRAEVDARLADGLLWPYPLVQLNPAFEPGETIDQLVDQGVLAPGRRDIFRARKSERDPAGRPLRLPAPCATTPSWTSPTGPAPKPWPMASPSADCTACWIGSPGSTARSCATFGGGYHWSFMQVEYALDIVFDQQAELHPLYEVLARTAIHALKAEQVATFLGRKLTDAYLGEIGNDFATRIQGTRIKHHMGPAAIKLYDKFGLILRIECTTNDVAFFKHHRMVEHRDGTTEFKLAPLRKSIYSLAFLRELMGAANARYLDFLAAIEDPRPGLRVLDKISRPVHERERSYRGFNLCHGDDLSLFQVILRGEFTITGFQAHHLRPHLP
jgi:hypothetical protein